MTTVLEWLHGAALALVGLFVAQPVPAGHYYGYAEGDYVRLAPREGGILAERPVRRGDRVAAGAAIGRLEDGSERAGVADAWPASPRPRPSLPTCARGAGRPRSTRWRRSAAVPRRRRG